MAKTLQLYMFCSIPMDDMVEGLGEERGRKEGGRREEGGRKEGGKMESEREREWKGERSEGWRGEQERLYGTVYL